MGLLDKMQGGEAQAKPSDLNLVPSDISAGLKDTKVGGRTPQENGLRESPLISYVSQRFTRSIMYRRPFEQMWLDNHRNYRGLYGPDLQFTSTEKSRLFIRVTKTKVIAAFGQLMDVLFANNQFPIQIDPEQLPEGVTDSESIETNPQTAGMYPGAQQGQQPQSQSPTPQQTSQKPHAGYPGDGTRADEMPSTVASDAIVGQLGQNESLQQGPQTSPTAVEIDPAMISAKKMQKKIQDQLRSSDGDKHLRHAAFECALQGTGIIKGPIAVSDVITEVDVTGKPSVTHKMKPRIEAVSLWNMYFDPDCRCVEDCDYIIQRHKLSMTQLRNLKTRPAFRSNEIDALIDGGYNYLRQWWEPFLQDAPMVQPVEKYEVLEFWGMVDKALLMEFGISETDIPKELQEADELPCNIWVSGHHILRLIINPFNNGRWPYNVVPYEIQPYTIYGIGVAESMADTQMLMNGFMRLAVDNAVISGNLIFEIDETALVPGQDFTLYPGKFWRKMGGTTGPAIVAHEFPNTAAANMQLYDKARALADEATFPSVLHGQDQGGAGRTSSGLSMTMGAASVSIRAAVSNWDDYCLRPLAQALFEFNLLNNDDPELAGNFVVSAGGVSSLMRDEVKSQRLMSALQLAEQPALAPLFNLPYIIRELCNTMGLDADKATNTDEKAQRMRLMLAEQAQQQNPQGQQPQQPPSGKKGTPAKPEQQGTNHTPPTKPGGISMPGDSSFSSAHSNGPAKHASPVSRN